MSKDYYQILGLSRSASQADIQKSYREKARRHHPDMNPDDKSAKETFQDIQHAYDVLSDQKKRELYDRYGSSFESMGAGGPGGGGPGGAGGGWEGFQAGPGGAGGEGFDFSQFFNERYGAGDASAGGGGGFSDFFSGFSQAGPSGRRRAGGRRRPRNGADLEHTITIPFATAVLGGQVEITVQRGDGKTETLTVNIPAGVEDGKKIRLRGQGEPGTSGGHSGDILLKLNVAAHPVFTRKGKNLHLSVPVRLDEAVLGAKIDIPTPSGTVTLTIPRATSGGSKLKVKGQGVAPKSKSPGDLIVTIQIVLDKQWDDESLEMIKKIAEAHPTEDPRGKLAW
jgi:curved DNA-binding protein